MDKVLKDKLKEMLKGIDFSSNPIGSIENAILSLEDQSLIEQFNANKTEIEKIISLQNLRKVLNYEQCYVSALNKNSNSWKSLSKDISLKVGKSGKPMDVKFESVPASAMKIFTHLKEGEGISSSDSSTDHLGNLWTTNVSSNGKTLFSGLRFKNTRGDENSTKELILAAAVNQYGLEKVQTWPENKTLNVKLGNVQLMSPVSKYNPLSMDKDKPFKQMEALKKLRGKSFDIQILDENSNPKKVRLCLVDVMLCNFGMNSQHFAMGGNLLKSSKKQNSEALESLVGKPIFQSLKAAFKKHSAPISKLSKEAKDTILKDNFVDKVKEGTVDRFTMGTVGRCLHEFYEKRKTSSQSEKSEIDLKIKKIINLVKQILDLWFTTKGQGLPSNPGAIQCRMALLMPLLGFTATFNCKSGKDRTGEMAAEINNLAIDIEANGDGIIPDPYETLTDAEKLQMSQVFDATRSSEIAEANTGFRGLKVDYSGIVNRTGKIRGASKLSNISSKT